MSSETLLRGCQILREKTMSLESDPLYAELVATMVFESNLFWSPCLFVCLFVCHFSNLGAGSPPMHLEGMADCTALESWQGEGAGS